MKLSFFSLALSATSALSLRIDFKQSRSPTPVLARRGNVAISKGNKPAVSSKFKTLATTSSDEDNTLKLR
jgi:hypothetical protein